MSFRQRLWLFFTIIVVIPMFAVMLVLFSLTADSETGKADAEIAQGLRSAFYLYDEARDDAGRLRDRIAGDAELAAALEERDRDAVAEELRRLRSRYPS